MCVSKWLVSLLLLLSFSSVAMAQLSLGGGFTTGAMFFFGNQRFFNSGTAGVTAEIAYAPPANESIFYPSLSLSINTMRLPARTASHPGLLFTATGRQVLFNLNTRLIDKKNALVLCGGFGISQVAPHANTRLDLDSISSTVYLQNDDDNYFHPVFNAGLRYMVRLSKNSPLYFGMEGQFRYTHFLKTESYKLSYNNTIQSARISKGMIAPLLLLSLHYRFGRDND